MNLALYCCWLGASGRGPLSPEALAAADAAVAPWRHQIVENFRAARRALKQQASAESEGLYTKAKAVELEAERLLQARLAARAPAVSVGTSREERLAIALANLSLYLGTAPAAPIHAALRDMADADFVLGGG